MCDRVDNNCNGEVDEGFADLGKACDGGDGDACADGFWVCNAAKDGVECSDDAESKVELCNGRDDDCDGLADDGFEDKGRACDGDDADACLDGVWVCTADGKGLRCEDGAAIGVEICDGLDNDCDQATDEGCDDDGDHYCDGLMTCVAGGGVAPSSCVLGCGDCDDANAARRPGATEACNDVDDDCDQATDEGCDDDDDGWCDFAMACSGTPTTCGFGCGDCKDLAAGSHPNALELCNGADDDCDGQVDEGFVLGASCQAGVGECARQGTIVCAANGGGTTCGATPGQGVTERCNGRDDDCDGFADEDFGVGAACVVGVGQCMREGVVQCVGEGAACSATIGAASDEICDGRDNDCDGATDESSSPFAEPVCAPLDTQILTAPQRVTASTEARFTYSNPITPSATTFDCSLDGGGWVACDGGTAAYFGVTLGSHVLLVRARGPSGAVDATPAFHGWTVDRSAPDTLILAGPDDPSQSGEATFLLGATVGDAAYWMCALDPRGATPRANEYVRCAALHEVSGLADGAHALWVYVVDSKGTADPEPAVWRWTVDRSAPETAITEAPAAHESARTASFAFHDPEDDAVTRFECRLDDGEWQECDGGVVAYTALVAGPHVFSVRAIDDAGVVDPTPDTYVWTVDLVAPDTTIPVHPDALSQSGRATFGFGSNESPVTFECALDPASATPAEGDWGECDATEVVGPLTDGAHVMWVRATDAAGLTDASPARFEWVIDTRSPETVITAGPGLVGVSETARFAFEDPEAPDHDAFECRVDGAAWAECDGGALAIAGATLGVGPHTLEVRSCRDEGPVELRCDPSPATWGFSVSAARCPSDTEAPVMTCQVGARLECVGGGAALDVAALAPSVSDGCGEVVVAHEGGEALVPGDNPVVFFARDGNGNVASCLTVVSVSDTVAPTIVCPEDVEVDNDAGLCGAAVTVEAATVADGCEAVEALLVVNDAPSPFPVGATTVTHRVIDRAGLAAECEQVVTVRDAELPEITCSESITVDAPADACAWEGALSAESSDNCGHTLELEEASGSFPVGTREVTFTALDEGGHKRSCATTLTVRDVTAPTVECEAFAGRVPAILHARFEDACGATAVVKEVRCVRIDGGEVAAECPPSARGDTLEVKARPRAEDVRVTWAIEARDASDNVATVTCELELEADADQDGVIDEEDLCPEALDPDQLDSDGDGLGDACDVCPMVADRGQADRDGDRIGDACEPDIRVTSEGGGGCDGGGVGVGLIALLALGLWRRRGAHRRE